MISLNRAEHALQCGVCNEKEGVAPEQMKNEQSLRVQTARMREDHSTCEQYQHNPARAQAERHFTVQMRALLRGIS
jgi:hypothetical protein